MKDFESVFKKKKPTDKQIFPKKTTKRKQIICKKNLTLPWDRQNQTKDIQIQDFWSTTDTSTNKDVVGI